MMTDEELPIVKVIIIVVISSPIMVFVSFEGLSNGTICNNDNGDREGMYMQ